MIQLGADEHFRSLREYLRGGYTEEGICREIGIPSLTDFDKREQGRPVRDLLVRLLFAGAFIKVPEFEREVPALVRTAMLELGLVTIEGGSYVCTVLVYETHGVLIASDRMTDPNTRDLRDVDPEFVYPAITVNTQSFLQVLPSDPCEAFLDIGSGTGVGVFAVAARIGEGWATDISERCTLFTEFNRRLNGLDNCHVLRGSLYEPVAGLTFDRIGVHPPYDLTLTAGFTFADGGDDGEFVIRGCIQGLPEHLRPGGEFFAQFRAADRRSITLEQRIREWLGDAHDEFDIALLERDIVGKHDFAFASAMLGDRKTEDYEAYMERFEKLTVDKLVYCALLIQRRSDTAPALTLRRRAGKRVSAVELRWMIGMERSLPNLPLDKLKPSVSPEMELHVRHRLDQGELAPVEYRLTVESPYKEDVPCPAWVARLAAMCTGQHTPPEIYEHLQKTTPVKPEEFDSALRRLIAIGAVQLASGSSTISSS